MNFSSHRDSEFSMEDYIEEFYREGTHKVSENIPIKDVGSLPLCTILCMITKFVGSIGLHLALKCQMTIAIKCLEPKTFKY